MSWFTRSLSNAGHWLGSAADRGAHDVGGVLDDVGLGQAGQLVDSLGDRVAGALDPEMELGQTDDPTELIHGDPGRIRASAARLADFSGAFGKTAAGLDRVDTSHWTGAAADAFRARYAPQPPKWRDASTATGSAGTALRSYADTVEQAQAQARQAISLYAQGQQASTLRQQAQQVLAAARSARDAAGAAAASAVRTAAALAPPEPGLWSQVGGDLSDLDRVRELATASIDAGIVNGAADIVKLVRDVNPLDPWNLTHPAEFVAAASGTGAGLVHDAVHTQDLVKQAMGGGWGRDPFEAVGRLVPQVALAVATAGAGAGADAGADAAADDAAAVAARPLKEMPAAGDPVDVATGDVVLAQADVAVAGSLPLVLGRAHRSSCRSGRWFGRSWASDLDVRLAVAGSVVAFAGGDGTVLVYPRPVGDEAVWPRAGARWPLARDGDGYMVTDPQAGTVRRFEPRSGFYLSADGEGELPLVSVTGRAGHQVRFEYGADGAPTAVARDGDCRVLVTTAGGRVAGLALAGAGPGGADVPLTTYKYSHAGDLAEVVNSSGLAQRFCYDDAGRMTEWTDRNRFSYRYTYDGAGRCVAGESPDGVMSGRFAYHDGLTAYTDAVGAVTTYQVTARGQVSAVTDPLGNVTVFKHDRLGRLVSRADPLGRVVRWDYDEAGRLTGLTGPGGSRAAAEYNERGLLAAATGPDGVTLRQEYDSSGNPTRVAGPYGTVTRYGYDAHGHLASVTGPDGAVTRVECGHSGLPAAVTGPDGARVSWERDAFGRVVTETGPDGAVTRLAWTAEGQLLSRAFPGGAAEQFGYDGEGNLAAYRDPEGAVTRYAYGAFGQLLSKQRPDGTRTTYEYDGALRLTAVTHAGLTWRYEHDPAGRLVSQTDYDGAVTRYAYDAAGQLTTQVNAAGQEITLAYDAAGRLAERAVGGVMTRFGYDRAGRLAWARSPAARVSFERDRLGRITAETCNGATGRSIYDAAGRRVRRVLPSGAQALWAYDAAGRPAALRTAGQHLRFGYDQAGRETLRDLPGGLHLAQNWDPAGRLAAQTLTGPAPGDGRVLQHRSYQWRDGALTGTEDLLSGLRRLSLDAAGRITAVTGPQWAEAYSYDPAGNVTAAAWPVPPPGPAGGTLDAWALDASAQGRRERSGTLIRRAGNIRYEHDAAGRVVARQRQPLSGKPETWRYTWNAESRLTSVTTPDGATWRYSYDPLGRRIAKQRLNAAGQAAGHVTFVWDGPLLAEQHATGPGLPGGSVTTWDHEPGSLTPLTQHTRRGPAQHGSGGGQQDAQDQADAQFYAIVTDLIGAPTELASPDGALAGYQQHTLWGATLWHPDGAATPLRFPGQYADDETGLHYNHHRYYDPATGAYLSPDPLGLAPALNPRAYVPNPTLHADPLGLMACSPAGGGPQMTVYRFHDASNPDSLLPRLHFADPATQARIVSDLQKYPLTARSWANDHMHGLLTDSPFVSLTTDPAKAAASSDPWLRTIATGLPGHRTAIPAPDLSTFRVPASRLIYPMDHDDEVIADGEVLWQGSDLGQYLIDRVPNPFLRVRIR